MSDHIPSGLLQYYRGQFSCLGYMLTWDLRQWDNNTRLLPYVRIMRGTDIIPAWEYNPYRADCEERLDKFLAFVRQQSAAQSR